MMKDIVVPKGLHRLSKQHPPDKLAAQLHAGNHGIQIGGDVGQITVNHIGSQVNHIRNGVLVASLMMDEPEPTRWPELLRASVWGGL